MPQKRNPDAAELVRAKVGRITGALVALLTVMKGLPLAYSKDMQEDKEQVFDAADALMLALAAMTGMAADMAPQAERLRAAAGQRASRPRPISPTGWCAGSACRSARRTTSPGRWSGWPRRRASTSPSSTSRRCRRCMPGITAEVFEVLGVENSVASRTSYGGTAPVRVREQAAPLAGRARLRRLARRRDAKCRRLT